MSSGLKLLSTGAVATVIASVGVLIAADRDRPGWVTACFTVALLSAGVAGIGFGQWRQENSDD